MTQQIEQSPALDHFVRLVMGGKHSGASGGQRRARRLALAALDHAPGLDALAIEGLCEFVEIAKYAPQETRELIK